MSVRRDSEVLSKTVVVLSQLVLQRMKSSSKHTYHILFIVLANRRPAWIEVITAACCLFCHFTLQWWFWSFAFLAAVQKVVMLIEFAVGKKLLGKQGSLQARQGKVCSSKMTNCIEMSPSTWSHTWSLFDSAHRRKYPVNIFFCDFKMKGHLG